MQKKEKYDLEAHDQRFGSEELCNQFLIDKFWGGKPTCDACRNNEGNHKLKTRKEFVCAKCNKQFSLTKGTIFERTRLPLRKWFKAIYLLNVDKGGISSILLAKYIGVQQKTAWLMLQKIRDAMKTENDKVLSGIVHADEVHILPILGEDRRLQALHTLHEEEQDRIHGPSKAKVAKQKKKAKEEAKKAGIPYPETRGRMEGSTKEVLAKKKEERGGAPYSSIILSEREPFEKGAIVLGMVEKRGNIVLKKLGPDSRSINKENMVPLLKKHIRPDSILITDGNVIYQETRAFIRLHLVAPRGKKFVAPDGTNSNAIENAWKHLRKVIRGTYIQVSYHHFDGYLNEYTYRWNRRDKNARDQFDEFFAMATQPKITLNELKARAKAS